MTKDFANPSEWKEIASTVLKMAKEKGATSAEVGCSSNQGFSVKVRLGEVETIEYHRDKTFDVIVFFDHQKGSSSTTDISLNSLHSTVDAACSIAKATGGDPCHGLADANLMAKNYPDLDLYYPWEIDVNEAIEMAKLCEDHGRQYDAQITNSGGANVTQHAGYHLFANSHGFMGDYFFSRHSMHCSLLAEANNNKERDYEFTLARDPKELIIPEIVGESAARKVVAKLDARKLNTCQTPVIFDSRVAAGILGHLVSAIRGYNLYNESSFLLNSLGKKIFPDFINIEEDPFIPKALGSAPFDSEGVTVSKKYFIEKGILKNYILDSYSARKLKMKTTGNSGGVHNLMIKPTAGNLEDLLKKMNKGLLVTDLMGQGVNIVTGDYSRGASGFWVENGQIQYPVHEITIASNLKEMFLNLLAVGNDVDKRGGLWSGSLLFENMTVAGD